jgi:hypothetical protein
MDVAGSEPIQLTYPSPFSAADRASLEGQKRHRLLVGGQLAALLVAAILSAWDSDVTALGTALSFAVAMLLWGALQMLRPERTWFDGRALAESLKTLAWRYAMAVPPFDTGGSAARSDERFRRECQALLTEQSHLASHLIDPDHHGALITDSMRAVRALDIKEKSDIYRDQRLRDQEVWYSSRAISNERVAARWQMLILGLQFVGFTAATLRVAGAVEFDAFSIISAFAGSAIAWFELRRYHELARAYAVAALEIATIASEAQTVDSKEDLHRIVLEGEGSISREHTLWHAKRL